MSVGNRGYGLPWVCRGYGLAFGLTVVGFWCLPWVAVGGGVALGFGLGVVVEPWVWVAVGLPWVWVGVWVDGGWVLVSALVSAWVPGLPWVCRGMGCRGFGGVAVGAVGLPWVWVGVWVDGGWVLVSAWWGCRGFAVVWVAVGLPWYGLPWVLSTVKKIEMRREKRKMKREKKS
uniref:Uncharacterized protein n=1 Tax=Fagus sylvatica TaxID=28930 RepID=A0A2N9HDC5_FAGSY